MNALAAAAQAVAQSQGAPSGKTEYDHGLLQIREKTLVIGNAIYSIANISRIIFSDLRNPVPTFVWVMLAIGVIMVLTVVGAGLGILLIAIACYLLYLNYKSRSAADYALSFQMNSGSREVIMSNDGSFLKAIAVELYEVIELEKSSNVVYNIDQRTRIDNVTNSSVRITGVQGEIVDNVRGI